MEIAQILEINFEKKIMPFNKLKKSHLMKAATIVSKVRSSPAEQQNPIPKIARESSQQCHCNNFKAPQSCRSQQP
jgi:hypothetical protein